jgi:hypothetical protein
MATIPFELLEAGPGFQLGVWKDMAPGDEGSPFDCFANSTGVSYSAFSVQVDGVFDDGAEVQLQGSVIPNTFSILTGFSTSDMRPIMPVDQLKPVVVGGGKSTKVTVGLLVTR